MTSVKCLLVFVALAMVSSARVETKNYFKDCLTPECVEKKIISHSAGLISKTFYGNARKFIDSDFIKNYREANPDERPIHLGTVWGNNCCELERAIPAIVIAIERKLHKWDKNVKNEFAGKREKLSSYLKKHLFIPCDGYRRALADLLSDLSDNEDLLEGGEEALLAGLSPKVQDDVFRYNLCENMRFESSHEQVVDLVLSWLEGSVEDMKNRARYYEVLPSQAEFVKQ